MKRCLVCGDPVAVKYVMCESDWMLVPPALQKAIWRLWNNGFTRSGYEEAVQNAVEQVNAARAG